MTDEVKELTRDEAIDFFGDSRWKTMSLQERAKFQISNQFLCMPFNVFHQAVEAVLRRPVYTHEFGLNMEGLRDEVLNAAEAPTLDAIVAMLPAEKTIVVNTGQSE